jgi:Carbohydrate esterase 2 N-terminal
MGTQVSMDLNDGNNKNRFTIVLDAGMPRTVTTASGQTTLALATGLPSGVHDVLILAHAQGEEGNDG